MKLYMKCTTDSLELPLAVADSTRELAKMLHMTNGSVAIAVSREVSGFHKVIIPECCLMMMVAFGTMTNMVEQ